MTCQKYNKVCEYGQHVLRESVSGSGDRQKKRKISNYVYTHLGQFIIKVWRKMKIWVGRIFRRKYVEKREPETVNPITKGTRQYLRESLGAIGPAWLSHENSDSIKIVRLKIDIIFKYPL